MNLSIRLFGKVLSLLLTIIFFTFIYYIHSLYQTVQEAKQSKVVNYKMLEKANELSKSSDLLTRFARNYVVTGDEKYKENYYKVLNIRDAKEFKSENYNYIYWNILEPQRSKIFPDTDIKSSLLDEIKKLPYTKQQLSKLEKSLKRSNKLVNLELKAFNAMKENKQKLAIDILYSDKYKLAKHNIMLPISELINSTYKNYKIDEDKTNKKINNLFRIIFILVISGISIFFIALFLLRKKILIPVEYLMDLINKLRNNDNNYKKIIYCNDEIGMLTEQLFNMKEQIDYNFEKLKELSTTDPLTGIKNRRSFFESSEKFFKLARRKGLALSIIMLDIDFFKKVNDTYGHIVGDEILKFISKIIEKELRDSDIFARYGGEEFIILLPDTDIEGAFKTANKLRKIVEDTPYEGDVEVSITISLGVAQLENEKIFNDLIKKADKALYKAKDSGRNIVIKAD